MEREKWKGRNGKGEMEREKWKGKGGGHDLKQQTKKEEEREQVLVVFEREELGKKDDER
jgi:hypothetical protein